MAKLSLNDIVNIVVNLSPRSAVRKGFNLGLFIGSSPVIDPEDRVKLYNSLDSMYEDGFREEMPEYKAASKYFQQTKKPTRVAIGRYVKTDGLIELSVNTEAGSDAGKFVVHIQPNTLPAGSRFIYKTAATSITTPEYDKVLTSGWDDITDGAEISATAGHLILVAEVDAENKTKKVGKASIGGDRISLGIPVGETALDAVRACRTKNTDWYLLSFCGATKEEILQISEYVETTVPSTIYAYTTNEQDVFKGKSDSIFGLLKGLSRRRTFGQYSETEDAVSAIIGYAMGANVKTARSAYTLMHKTETGVLTDDLNDTQVNFLQKANGNYYVSRGCDGEYSMFENGVMADGCYFDEIINLDMLVNDMQLAILDLMKSRPKIPQTEAGMNDIKLAIKPCLETMKKIGFISPGKWNGSSIYLTSDYCALETGEMLTDGYLILSEPVDEQSQADRDARKAPNIYTPIKLAGAIHTVLVQIDVNR